MLRTAPEPEAGYTNYLVYLSLYISMCHMIFNYKHKFLDRLAQFKHMFALSCLCPTFLTFLHIVILFNMFGSKRAG